MHHEKYAAAKARHLARLEALGATPDEYELINLEARWLDAIQYLKEYDIVDGEYLVNDLLLSGKSVLCEGASRNAT